MRALIWIVVLAGAAWSGVWFAASTAVQRGAEGWLLDQEARGLVVERSDLTVRGFPNRLDLTVSNLHLADPETGLGWRAPFAQLFAMTWKPWHLIAALPAGQVVDLPDGQALRLDGQEMMGSLEVHPSRNLGLYRTRAGGKALRLSSSAGWVLAADSAFAATEEDPSLANTHRIGLTVAGLVPDPAFHAALSETDLPAVIDRLHLDAYASFSAPLDRHAGQSDPHLTALELRDAAVIWGKLQVTAKGSLMPGADGLAEGEISLRIEGWQRLLPVAVAAGVLTQDQAEVLTKGFASLAQSGGNPDVLSLPLRARGGRLSLGPIPLGPAPRLQ